MLIPLIFTFIYRKKLNSAKRMLLKLLGITGIGAGIIAFIMIFLKYKNRVIEKVKNKFIEDCFKN